MVRLLTSIVLALAFSFPALAIQGGGGPPQPWKKTCRFGERGEQGCTVGIEMRISPYSPCSPGCAEYCVKIVIACPGGTPAGDPAENCEFEDCEICCNNTAGISLSCDGQCFKVSASGNWDAVANDCSSATATATGGACP